jgi:hypothetical protein
VTTERPEGSLPSTTMVWVLRSNVLAWPGPLSGRTSPAGGAVVGGESAARAGAMVGGGASAEWDEQAAHATSSTAIATL